MGKKKDEEREITTVVSDAEVSCLKDPGWRRRRGSKALSVPVAHDRVSSRRKRGRKRKRSNEQMCLVRSWSSETDRSVASASISEPILESLGMGVGRGKSN